MSGGSPQAPGAPGPRAAGRTADSGSDAGAENPVYILAVDDKPANLLALERVLAGIPATVIKATSGEAALAASLRHRFALAIVDVQMPGMDGYELAEILLADPATARIPIIFVTAAYSDESHVFKGYNAGAVDYIVKPYDPALMVAKARVFLELALHRQRLEGTVARRTTELAASEDRFDDLFNLAPQGLLIVDADGRVVRCNHAADTLLGCTARGLAGRNVVEVLPAYTPEVVSRATSYVREPGTGLGPAEDWLAVRGDGLALRTEVRLARVVLDERDHVIVSVTDVSERVAAMEGVERSLREKDVLLREIHHRVKNNLQIVTSLLRLQSGMLDSDDARAPLEDSIGRVRSMALVHQQLYGQESLERIDLGEYVRTLGNTLHAAFSPDARLSIEADPVAVSLDVATPLGLILNELIINAFKHGRAPPRQAGANEPAPSAAGSVRIELRERGGRLVIVVADTGPGVADSSRAGQSDSLGMQLVRSLGRQLRAQLRFENDGGLRVTIDCPLT